MEMHTDDELYRVDDVYLGPRGRPLPFRVRYRAYWVGGALYILLILLEMWSGLLGILPALYALVATIYATTQLMRHVDHDRPLRATAAALCHEIAAPRPTEPSPSAGPARRARPDTTRIRRHAPPENGTPAAGRTTPGAS